jgi:hypothetical protein
MPGRAGGCDNRPATEILGRFNTGAFAGMVTIEERSDDIRVVVVISTVPQVPAPAAKPIPAETVQAWMLRTEGRTSSLKARFPLADQSLIGIGSDGYVDWQAHFMFEKIERPLAVVVRIGGQFHVFDVPRKPRGKWLPARVWISFKQLTERTNPAACVLRPTGQHHRARPR